MVFLTYFSGPCILSKVDLKALLDPGLPFLTRILRRECRVQYFLMFMP